MRKRLSGALAWGALLLIIGIPGADMLGRQAQTADSASTSPATAADANGAPAWQSAANDGSGDVFGPSPAGVENAAPPSLGTLPANGTGDGAQTEADAGARSIVTIDTATHLPDVILLSGAPTPSATLPSVLDLADTPDAVETLPADPAVIDADSPPDMAMTETASAPATRAAEIAARVRDVLFSGSPATNMELQASTDATLVMTEATEPVPYPAPAIWRPEAPAGIAVAMPEEPTPEIRPDNAVFFNDWTGVPSRTTATLPGRF